MIGNELGDLRRSHYSIELGSLDEGTVIAVGDGMYGFLLSVLMEILYLQQSEINLEIFRL